LSILEQATYNKKEKSILYKALTTTLLQAQTLLSLSDIARLHYHYNPNHNITESPIIELFNNCKFFCSKLWLQLKYPAASTIRTKLIQFIITLDTFLQRFVIPYLQTTGTQYYHRFIPPKVPNFPSVVEQVSYLETTIDPYVNSLQKNYYFPIQPTEMTEPDPCPDQHSLQVNPNNCTQDSSTSSPKPAKITVEDSLEVIDELIQNLQVYNDDEMVDSSQPSQTTTVITEQPSTLEVTSMRFSLYRTSSTRSSHQNPTILPLIKLFFKCILSTDSKAKIHPIQAENKVSPIKTSDQITELTLIGARNYFKGNRGSNKTLAGDFHISTSLTFEDFKSHTKISSWLALNGYRIILNECQTSDMVLIGILSRIRTFTWRDDLKQSIMDTEMWKNSPFHLRLYPGTFSSNANSLMTTVMMVEVDRPNIQQGLKFFKEHFDGDTNISPCNIPHLFFCLYKNTLSDEERKKIIKDNELHIGNVSTVHMQGIKNIDEVITLKQNIKVKLRKLLLSLRASNTANGKIFIQIEKQAEEDWLTCAYYTADSTIVMNSLNTIVHSLRQCIIPEDLNKVFADPNHSLHFVTKTIPIKKGKIHIASKPIPADTQAHTDKMLGKLVNFSTKRTAPVIPPHNTTANPINKSPSPASNAWTSTSQTASSYSLSTVNSETKESPSINSEAERRFKLLEQSVLQGSERMDRLESVCTQMMHNTEIISNQIQKMAADFYSSDSTERLSKAAKTS
jgi:hypothetical protein